MSLIFHKPKSSEIKKENQEIKTKKQTLTLKHHSKHED